MSPIQSNSRHRLAVDIGGTFTDVVLDSAEGCLARKVLTTHERPADAVMQGIDALLSEAQVAAGQIDLVLHGTTLATNALIERRGAKTALLTTQGHRDVLEMAFENRFEQYDVNIDRPQPLVPRALRLPVPERTAADGSVLLALDEAKLLQQLAQVRAAGVTSIAVGYLHAWRNPAHEQLTAQLINAHWPDVAVSLSSEVCPEIREYERLSTTCANAYVMPLMSRYLEDLAERLLTVGIGCPLRLMTSGGGLTTLSTAQRFPIRLVESGPAGGAILASTLAAQHGDQRVLSFDMGGTTAKLCLIDDGEPLQSRAFEVDRAYRFKKGSGLPVRIPVVEMVEIGAGGGSIASIDRLGRVQVGPESAGSQPGPVAYGRGGVQPTVTDADVLLGRIATEGFAAAGLTLDPQATAAALTRVLAEPLATAVDDAAHRLCEVVDENMAAASRAHAGEWGQQLEGRMLIAFGGAAPLHAARLAQKLGIERILIPAHAGVGSALGFLLAPVRYEVVRSRFELLSQLDAVAVQKLFQEMRREAATVVEAATKDVDLHETRRVYMRYQGQGYEIAVGIGEERLQPGKLRLAFEATYEALYGRIIPDIEIEVMSWTLTLGENLARPELLPDVPLEELRPVAPDAANAALGVFDAHTQKWLPVQQIARSALSPGTCLQGPARITEAHTTTYVPAGMQLSVCADGALLMEPGT
ncbi:MAG: hydantoinase/oxoprolinase family protein [Pseudomonadales bacterium]